MVEGADARAVQDHTALIAEAIEAAIGIGEKIESLNHRVIDSLNGCLRSRPIEGLFFNAQFLDVQMAR
jgi:hypothetical protein